MFDHDYVTADNNLEVHGKLINSDIMKAICDMCNKDLNPEDTNNDSFSCPTEQSISN